MIDPKPCTDGFKGGEGAFRARSIPSHLPESNLSKRPKIEISNSFGYPSFGSWTPKASQKEDHPNRWLPRCSKKSNGRSQNKKMTSSDTPEGGNLGETKREPLESETRGAPLPMSQLPLGVRPPTPASARGEVLRETQASTLHVPSQLTWAGAQTPVRRLSSWKKPTAHFHVSWWEGISKNMYIYIYTYIVHVAYAFGIFG